METLALGAEAVIRADEGKKLVLKQRQPKRYRVKELDERLRTFRTKREAKILEKLSGMGVAVPKLIAADEQTATIRMELVKGSRVRDVLNGINCERICGEAGEMIGKMHNSNIIHGDLTTSNMILGSRGLCFIDFGLGFFSDKAEDKAVDLHLLKQALNSSHSRIAGKCFAAVVKGYKRTNSGSSEILKRLEKVEGRGRYKGKLMQRH